MMNHAVNWAVYEAMGLWGGNDTVSQAVNRAVTKRGKPHPGLGVYLAAGA